MVECKPLTVAVGLLIDDSEPCSELEEEVADVLMALVTAVLADIAGIEEVDDDSIMVEIGLRTPEAELGGGGSRLRVSRLLTPVVPVVVVVVVVDDFLRFSSLCKGPSRHRIVPWPVVVVGFNCSLGFPLDFEVEPNFPEDAATLFAAVRNTTAGLVALDNEPICGIDDVEDGRFGLVDEKQEVADEVTVARFNGRLAVAVGCGRPEEEVGEVMWREVDNEDGEVIELGGEITGDRDREVGTVVRKKESRRLKVRKKV